MKMIFGQRLLEIRKERSMTQRDFAKLIGATQGALCHWELGENIPKIDMLYQIAKKLDMSADYLIGLKD